MIIQKRRYFSKISYQGADNFIKLSEMFADNFLKIDLVC